MQIKNPEKLECSQCTNERIFRIIGIDRIGDTKEWDVLIQCEYCLMCTNYRFTGFAFPDKLIRHIKTMISEQTYKERPTSYTEFDLKSGHVFRTTHKDGLYEDISNGYNR